MTKIEIILSSTGRAAALLAGQPAQREQTYSSDDPGVARAALAAGGWVDTDGTAHLSTGSVGGAEWARDSRPADALEAIATYVSMVLERARIRDAEIERSIVEALALPDDKWLAEPRYYGDRWAAHDPSGAGRGDPRIAARLDAVRPEAERREAARQADERHKADAEAAKVKATEVASSQLREWAMLTPLARAAAEGYEVDTAVLDLVAERLVGALDTVVARADMDLLVEGRADYDDAGWEERSAPSPKAFEVLDAVKPLAEGIDRPECVKVAVSKISRFSPASDTGDDGEDESPACYTAVIITIACPALKLRRRAVVVRAE